MPPRLPRSKRAGGPSSANGGSNARRWPTASRKPVIGSSRLPGYRAANGRARALPMRSNGSMRNSSAGSRPRRCCLPPKPQPCCSGHCSPRVRSQCVKSTGGRPYTRNSLTSRLTSLPDPVSSSYRRPRHQIPTQIATAPTCMGKGLFVIEGNNTTVRNLTLTRSRVPDMNGAGIRLDNGSLTVDTVRFIDNQTGILGGVPGTTVTVLNSDFDRNGTCGAVCAHAIYIVNVDLV